MKCFTIIIGCLISISVNSQSLQDARSSFHKAVMKPDASREFHETMESDLDRSATLLAYQAVSEALLAQVIWNPFSKLSQVMKYDRIMQEAVMNDPDNIEIRFLRLAIEVNLPDFLGMSEHIQEDRDMIVQNMSEVRTMNLEKSYGQYIFFFLNEAGLCTEEEIDLMESVLAINGI
ncbi:MAG: hypothetical protein AB8B73_04700 [Ekhidna sp.]